MEKANKKDFFALPNDDSKSADDASKGFLPLARKINTLTIRLHAILAEVDDEIGVFYQCAFKTCNPIETYYPVLMMMGDWYRCHYDVIGLFKEYWVVRTRLNRLQLAYSEMLDGILKGGER